MPPLLGQGDEAGTVGGHIGAKETKSNVGAAEFRAATRQARCAGLIVSTQHRAAGRGFGRWVPIEYLSKEEDLQARCAKGECA